MPYLVLRSFDRRDVTTDETNEFYRSASEAREEYDDAVSTSMRFSGAESFEFTQGNYRRTTVSFTDGTSSVIELTD